MLYLILLSMVMFALMVVLMLVSAPARRRALEELIAEQGGEIQHIDYFAGKGGIIAIDYVVTDGSLRRAMVKLRKQPVLLDDQPIQHFWLLSYPDHNPLREVLLAVESKQLPGHEGYERLVRRLAGGEPSIVLREADASPDMPRLGAVLQCIELASNASDRSHRLAIFCEGQAVDITWHVDGTVPNRVLTLTRLA